ncbi:hypothetical protein CRE_27897 [Caenorhabditis remanei]|uniref:Glycosyltransferase family 92 protein n=1 Tax=Caenorhabditis remanei TaxID=31234 RepID=E3NI19_CAERE|nr:hypothetical protein CRE_27897 [Caenorhabditis remanei]
MKAIGLYQLISLIPTLVNSCLVVKSPPCTCPITLLDRTNIDQMSENPWYDYVVQRPLVTPTVQYISNCVAWTKCQLNYTLYDIEYIHPTEIAMQRLKPGSLLMGNACIILLTGLQFVLWRYVWNRLLFNQHHVSSEKEFCTPKTNTTFLFAYSNDMDATKVQEIVEFLSVDDIRAPQFTTLANIRFDVLQEESIEYHKNYEDWITAMGSKLPDPSLSFTSPETGSDVLKVISKFINNTQVPICGSRIFILLKRFPNEQDITELVAQMKKYRVYVYIATSFPPSGGSHPETIRRLTTQTNGLDYYYEDTSFTLSIALLSPFFFDADLIYAANVNLSPNGLIALPEMIVPRHEYSFYFVTYPSLCTYIAQKNYENMVSKTIYFNASVYDMQLDYEIGDDIVYAVQIRIYTSGSDGYWIPYDD